MSVYFRSHIMTDVADDPNIAAMRGRLAGNDDVGILDQSNDYLSL